jgi:hypothetical protein
MDADFREAVLADWRAEAAIPVPPDTSQLGCAVAIIAAALAAGLPPLLRFLGVALPPGAGGVVLGSFGIVFAWGIFRGLTGRAKGFNAVAGRAAEALGYLTTHPEDRSPAARRAAVALLQCAFFSSGPSTASTFEIAAARERLGPALPFVLDVERVLVEGVTAYPVFSLR